MPDPRRTTTAGHSVLPSRSDTVVPRDAPQDVGGDQEAVRLLGMYWFLLFLAVVAVWLLVLALLAWKLWRQGKALTRELVAAQSKLEAAQSAAGSGQTREDVQAPA